MAQEAFKISAEVMRPTSCPACGYSWQGLLEPRCPECGERVNEGEVVVLGVPKDMPLPLWGSWLAEIACWLVITIVVVTVLVVIGNASRRIAINGTVVMLTLSFLMITVHWWQLRRYGTPPGVLRMSAEGYCFGAGETRTQMRAWAFVGQLLVHQRREGVVRIRESLMWGDIVLHKNFEIFAVCTPEQVAGIAERLHAWGVKDIKVILKEYARR